MNDKENIIQDLENDIQAIEKTLLAMKQKLQALKDLVWDKQSKKESSQMYKVLKEDKGFTQVKSEVGNIKVDKDFMQKQIKKHLDNPNLRGMVSTKEMLCFPKVAKNVKALYDTRHKSYTWKVKANDESILRYGSREYEVDGKNANRLLTNYSETEYGERQGRGEQGQLRQEFNDRDFLHPVNKETIPNPSLESQIQSEEEKLFDEMLKTQEKINDMPRIKDFKEAFEKDLEKSFNVETSEENLQKDTKEKTNPKLRQKR